MTNKRIMINLDKCIECRSCEVACMAEHRGFHNLVRSSFQDAAIPSNCRHCEDPSCAAACPMEALEVREDGIVRRYASRCIGCKSCIYACPFGAIDEELLKYTISKCDLSEDRIKEGRLPACVASCPTGALTFEDVQEVLDKELIGARSIGKKGVRR